MNRLKGVLYTDEEIDRKVKELGKQIREKYSGRNITCLCILKGASIFFADLVRELDTNIRFDFMSVSSYGSATSNTGAVQILKDLEFDIEGQHLLIVEDILDTGLTLTYIKSILSSRNPASIEICCLFDKPSRRKTEISAEYVGFSIPDEFIVGYGMDYAEKYRNLKDVCILELNA